MYFWGDEKNGLDRSDKINYVNLTRILKVGVAAIMLHRPETPKARVKPKTLHVTAINRAFPT